MTQQLYKQQGLSKRPCKNLDSRNEQKINALEFGLKYSKDFRASQNTYTSYEIDSVEEDFGELFRVWDGRTLLGSLNENAQGRWTANPYYQDKQLIELDKDLSQTFDSRNQAIAYIKATYEGKSLIVAA